MAERARFELAVVLLAVLRIHPADNCRISRGLYAILRRSWTASNVQGSNKREHRALLPSLQHVVTAPCHAPVDDSGPFGRAIGKAVDAACYSAGGRDLTGVMVVEACSLAQ